MAKRPRRIILRRVLVPVQLLEATYAHFFTESTRAYIHAWEEPEWRRQAHAHVAEMRRWFGFAGFLACLTDPNRDLASEAYGRRRPA